MARPEKLSKSRPPLQVQTASTQNALHRTQFRHPFSPSQPVSACFPGWDFSSSNTTTSSTTNNNNLSPCVASPTPESSGAYNRDRNWSVSSAPLPPPVPMPHSSRPRTMVRRTSCPGLSRLVSQTAEILANEAAWERDCGSYGYGEGMHGDLSRKLDQIITLIDEGLFNRERDLGELLYSPAEG